MSTKPVVHALKTLPRYFEAVLTGEKEFEIRRNDRGFKVGDVLRLQEFRQGAYTDRECRREVVYMTDAKEFDALQEGFVVLGLSTGLHGCVRCGREDSETANGCDLCLTCAAAEPEPTVVHRIGQPDHQQNQPWAADPCGQIERLADWVNGRDFADESIPVVDNVIDVMNQSTELYRKETRRLQEELKASQAAYEHVWKALFGENASHPGGAAAMGISIKILLKNRDDARARVTELENQILGGDTGVLQRVEILLQRVKKQLDRKEAQ